MEPIITSETLKVEESEFVLVDVSNGMGYIGVCNVSKKQGAGSSDAFFIGNEPLINVTSQNKTNNFSDKMITQCGSRVDCEETIISRISVAADSYFLHSQGLQRSIQPVLEMLTDGLYVVHVSKMFPGDGAGNFFWNSYILKHEISGSAKYNLTMGVAKNYSPCFIVPTLSLADYVDSVLKTEHEKLKNGKKMGGVAYHLSGMFCALLDGHHAATSALLNDVEFDCIVIEPVSDVFFESDEVAKETGLDPQIIGLQCPFVKIPLTVIPKNIMENFLIKRKYSQLLATADMKKKAEKVLKMKNNRIIPSEAYVKAGFLPDIEMVESANAVKELNDDQIEALLHGETELSGITIISSNYYMSVVTACNFLQYKNFDKFLYFAESILNNVDLVATHIYIANRIKNHMNAKINAIFCNIFAKEEVIYDSLKPIAQTYIERYSDYVAKQEQAEVEAAASKEKLIRDAKLQVAQTSKDILQKMSRIS